MNERIERATHALLQNNEGLALLDANLETLFQSPSFTRIFGRESGWLEVLAAEDRVRLLRAFEDLRARPAGSAHVEFPLQDDTGRRWIEATLTNHLDHAEIRALVVSMREVTARLAAERETRSFFALAPDLMVIAGLDGRFRRVNDSWTRTLGWSAEELTSLPWLHFVHPDDQGTTATAGARLVGGLRVIDFENRYRCKDGSYRWLQWTSLPVPEEGLVYGIARDVTHRRETEERDRLLFAESPLPMWLLDGETLRFLDVNKAATTTYGYSRAEFLERSLFDLVVEEQETGAKAAAMRALAEGEVPVVRRKHRTRTGAILDVEGTGHRLQMGDRTHILASVRDVTLQRRLEERLQEAQKLEAVASLAGGVAHDFNNLLTVILNHARLSIDELAPGTQREALEEICTSAVRAAELTRQLLAFSRKQILEPRVVDLGDVVNGLNGILTRVLGESIQLVHSSPAPALVNVDPSQIEQALVNLAANAREAMPGGGSLTIGIAPVTIAAPQPGTAPVPPGDWIVLEARDTGTGMDRDTLARAFEPFFTTKSKSAKGSGLGLSTVLGIVKQSGGQVVAESQPGRGSTFRIYLPRAASAPASAAAGATEAAGDAAILVVDDEEQLRKLISRVLSRKGYQVLVASDGLEALELVRSGARIDLILTDLEMPKLGGLELSRLLSQQTARPRPRMLFMSGYSDAAVSEGLVPGTRLLHKPFDPPALVEAVQAALSDPSGPISARPDPDLR